MTATQGIPAEIRARINRKLVVVAAKHGVRILLAIEFGSRAWGFPSPDSNYDERFVYAHERDWYFSIDERRDVIELPLAGTSTWAAGMSGRHCRCSSSRARWCSNGCARRWSTE